MSATDEFLSVPRASVEWLKENYPALTEKAGMCERIGGRLYTKTAGIGVECLDLPDGEEHARYVKWASQYTRYYERYDAIPSWLVWQGAITDLQGRDK